MSTTDDPDRAEDCAGCTRRFVLRGIAIGAGVSILGCGTDNGGTDPGVDAAPIDTGVSMCGSNVCIDLTASGAASLANVDGSLVLSIPGDRIVVIKTADSTFAALSNICTHAGCTSRFDGSSKLVCPCHGSQFSLTGSVLRGPASKPLQTYPVTLAGTVITIQLV